MLANFKREKIALVESVGALEVRAESVAVWMFDEHVVGEVVVFSKKASAALAAARHLAHNAHETSVDKCQQV